MANPFSNMDPDEWPEGVSAEEVMDLVDDVQYMKDHQNDGPLPGTTPGQ